MKRSPNVSAQAPVGKLRIAAIKTMVEGRFRAVVPLVQQPSTNRKGIVMMHYGIKSLGLSLFAAMLALSSGMGRAAELPSAGELLEQVTALQEGIAVLEESGHLNHGQATALSKKLDRVTKALSDLNPAEADGGVTTQQQEGSFLRALQRAINALLDFVSELTELVTDLPSEVVQPIIDAAIALLRDLIGLLLGGA
jgi:hypothetical protein